MNERKTKHKWADRSEAFSAGVGAAPSLYFSIHFGIMFQIISDLFVRDSYLDLGLCWAQFGLIIESWWSPFVITLAFLFHYFRVILVHAGIIFNGGSLLWTLIEWHEFNQQYYIYIYLKATWARVIQVLDSLTALIVLNLILRCEVNICHILVCRRGARSQSYATDRFLEKIDFWIFMHPP